MIQVKKSNEGGRDGSSASQQEFIMCMYVLARVRVFRVTYMYVVV